MKQYVGKMLRFFLNFMFYMVVLVSVTYYCYSTPMELYGIKHAILQLESALFLALFMALILAGINEITTLFIIRMSRGKKP